MATLTQKPMTAEEFLRMPEPPCGGKQELVRGEMVMMVPPGFRHGFCQVRVARLLAEYADYRGLGRITVESGLVTERDPDTVRGPDVAYWSAERLPLDQMPAGYPDVAADLTVEVISPSDTRRGVQAKALEYLARCVRMVWLVDPEARTVTVYGAQQEVRILQASDMLSGDDVLPGFQCAVTGLFGEK